MRPRHVPSPIHFALVRGPFAFRFLTDRFVKAAAFNITEFHPLVFVITSPISVIAVSCFTAFFLARQIPCTADLWTHKCSYFVAFELVIVRSGLKVTANVIGCNVVSHKISPPFFDGWVSDPWLVLITFYAWNVTVLTPILFVTITA